MQREDVLPDNAAGDSTGGMTLLDVIKLKFKRKTCADFDRYWCWTDY